MVSLANAAAETRNMFLRSLGFLVILISATQGYPSTMSDGRRYNQIAAYTRSPFLYQTRATRPYASYYDSYSQDFDRMMDLWYSQDGFDKYRYYPYYPEPIYYPEQYIVEDEESPEEDDLSSQQDLWYNNANAVFLQNLILAQLYKDAPNKTPLHPFVFDFGKPANEDYDDRFVYGQQVRQVTPVHPKEDKDVRELKSLVDTAKQRRKESDPTVLKSTKENRWVNKREEDALPTTTVKTPRSDVKGQDEILMPRPATPVRTSNSFHHRAYQPSVYDAIKKLLIQQENESNNRQPQKRSYVLSEDSLVEELGNLKKKV